MYNPIIKYINTPAYNDPVGLTVTSPNTIVYIASAIPIIPNIEFSSITFSPLILFNIKFAVPPYVLGFRIGYTDAV